MNVKVEMKKTMERNKVETNIKQQGMRNAKRLKEMKAKRTMKRKGTK